MNKNVLWGLLLSGLLIGYVKTAQQVKQDAQQGAAVCMSASQSSNAVSDLKADSLYNPELFRIVQRIKKEVIVAALQKEMSGYSEFDAEGKMLFDSPKIEQGIVLELCRNTREHQNIGLLTPWGKLVIPFRWASHWLGSSVRVRQEEDMVKVHERILQMLGLEKLFALRLAPEHGFEYCQYAIEEFDGQKLPSVKMRDQHCETMWKLLSQEERDLEKPQQKKEIVIDDLFQY